MGEVKRLSRVARECNVGIQTIVEFLAKKGFFIDSNPNAKIPPDALELVMKEYQHDLSAKREAEQFIKDHRYENRATISLDESRKVPTEEEPEVEEVLLIQDTREATQKAKDEITEKPAKTSQDKNKKAETIDIEVKKPAGIKVVGKVELDKPKPKKKAEQTEKVAIPPTVAATEVELIDDKTADEVQEIDLEVAAVTGTETGIEAKAELADTLLVGDPVDTKPAVEEPELTETTKAEDLIRDFKVVGRIDIDSINQKTRPAKKSKKEKEAARLADKQKNLKPQVSADKADSQEQTGRRTKPEVDEYKPRVDRLVGPTVVGKISLPADADRKKSPTDSDNETPKKKKRKRIRKDRVSLSTQGDDKTGRTKVKLRQGPGRVEVSTEDVDAQIKDTLSRIGTKGKSKTSKNSRLKRDAVRQSHIEDEDRIEKEKSVVKVTEFVTANELANMMDVPVNEIISTCMSLGLFVSINQRLDAETIAIVADEFGFQLEFVSVELQESIAQEADDEADMLPRPPIVTVMGHVDHGKTSLLDYIRKTNIIAGEAGGITQHIGAYKVELDNGKTISFLDTPGHEAFTAMRARGAQVTDIAIIVVSADDAVMPQTIEAINHASAAGVPIVFAINKIDKEGANPEKIREQLSAMNYLVEDWGGKYQSQEISAKKGIGITELLEKVLLEAELLDLKANPNKHAHGSVIESTLDRGRGYVTTILVQAGTLKVGDILLAGHYFGKVKAMFNERGNVIKSAGPSEPVLVLGLDGAAQAGDNFNIMNSEREAREIAVKREQLQREQETRTRRHITLDEIGRRIAIGNFQELNLIVKGDVDGSVEALSDSLIKLSTPEIQVNIKHQAVGQISESDILLASASNAIVVGFQVRPSLSARKLAEKEDIEIRLYSIIYDAINEIKAAMEGMLSPEIKEEITGTVEVQETFRITKVGTIAGCMVRDGKILKISNVRVIREGIVVYDGKLQSLKRFKDEVKEVVSGLECGLNIENYNDVKVGDIVEAYTKREVKKTL